MTITVFDKFTNAIPTTIFEGRDVSKVILVDPEAGLPPFFLANKGVLDTTTKQLKVYDESGLVKLTISLEQANLTPLLEAIDAVDKKADKNADDITAINLTVGNNASDIAQLQSDLDTESGRIDTIDTELITINGNISGNTSDITQAKKDISQNASDISKNAGEIAKNAAAAATNATDIKNQGGKITANSSDIASLTIRVKANEDNVDAVTTTANDADKLSKENKDRLDNLPSPADLSGYAKLDTDVSFTKVTLADVSIQSDSDGLGVTANGLNVTDSEDSPVFVVSDTVNVYGKRLQQLSDAVNTSDAVNLKQLNAVSTVASGADTLSKENKDRLDKLPAIPNMDEYARLGADVNFNNMTLAEYIIFANELGTDVQFKGYLDFKLNDESKLTITNDSVDLGTHLNVNGNNIINIASGGDNDSSAANIGDVKRIATSGAGLKPVDETWDMLGYPVLNVAESILENSAATVGQINALGELVSDNNDEIVALDLKVDGVNAEVVELKKEVSQNTHDLVSVTKTASDADKLSKENKDRLDALPPIPSVDGFIKNGDSAELNVVQVNQLKVRNSGDDSKFTDIHIDDVNNNTVINNLGGLYLNTIDKDTGNKDYRALYIDTSGRATFDQKIATPVICSTHNWSTNSTSDDASFIDLTETDTIKIGAKNSVLFDIGGNVTLGVYRTNVNFSNADYVTGIKMRDVGDRQPYDAVNWEVAQELGFKPVDNKWDMQNLQVTNVASGGDVDTNAANIADVKRIASSPDLSGYAKLDTDVSFHKIEATGLNFSGSGANAEILHDQNIDVKISGNGVVAFKQNGLKLLQSLDGHGQNLNAMGNINLNSDKYIRGSATGNLRIDNLGVIARNSTNDANSVTLGSGENIYKSDSHVFKNNSDDELAHINSSGFNIKGKQLIDVAEATADTNAPNLAQVKALIEAGGGSSGGMEGFKAVNSGVTGSKTYYQHSGEDHLYIEYTGSGGNITFDSMRNGADIDEDQFLIHNMTSTDMYVTPRYNQTGGQVSVPAHSYLYGWANRSIGKWVTLKVADPNYVPTQLVIKADDLNWSTSSDPRTNTKRMVEAAPATCTIIGRHVSNGNAKQKIISVGDTNRVESQTSTYVINKHSSNHSTGICTSEESSGKTWSRILDGKRGAWFTNESANSRMASVDINPSEYPENQIFYTTDRGIMETYLNESNGEIELRPLEGYNVPKLDEDVADLQEQNELGKSKTYYFQNETKLSYDWNNPENRPLTEVYVLNSTQPLELTSIDLTDDANHIYTGKYNSVGVVCIDTQGKWSNFSYHNAYKHESQNYYVVMNYGIMHWTLIDAHTLHTSIGDVAANSSIELGTRTQLPETFGEYIIDNNFEDINSLEFVKAEVNVQYDDINTKVIIDFNGSYPSGYVIIK